jgi:hypothetical protein
MALPLVSLYADEKLHYNFIILLSQGDPEESQSADEGSDDEDHEESAPKRARMEEPINVRYFPRFFCEYKKSRIRGAISYNHVTSGAFQ